MLDRLIRGCLEQRLVVALLAALLVGWGLRSAPFDIGPELLPRDPVPVDAIPDLGENQQVVFSEWMGRSPQDVEDQVTYPLTVALLGVPGVRTVRSSSAFGFSTIYVIFDEDVEFYWSRSRVLETLASLPRDALPDGVAPSLGPDATPLGQVFWYTLEGRDEQGRPAGGWDLDELRSIQDWQVRYALASAAGVAEVASVGGHVRELQVDVDPDALHAHGVTLEQVYAAVRASNSEVGARMVEINRVEYLVRGLGWVEDVTDIEQAVILARDGVALRVGDVASVVTGPALRRGALDKGGSEAVGGVVVARYGANPQQVIDAVRARIAEIAPGLPRRRLADGRSSQVTVVPFYDRSGLIAETLATLGDALRDQVLVTVLVVLVMVGHLIASLLVAALLPIAVLASFVGMKLLGIDANVVALSGIAIAIGTMVDMGIILVENILTRLEEAPADAPRLEVVHRATREVGSAVLTAVATTVIGFLPVFTMTGAEGKLFAPLAWTKTLALVGSVIVAMVLLPAAALTVLRRRGAGPRWATGAGRLLRLVVLAAVALLLARTWEPLGAEGGELANLVAVAGVILGLLGLFWLVRAAYVPVLRWCLEHKLAFLCAPLLFAAFGASVWLGFGRAFAFVPAAVDAVGLDADSVRSQRLWVDASHALPGLGKQFMPPLDEGSWLFMPTTMPHASIGEVLEQLAIVDRAIETVPEVDQAVGKLGRVDSALDPAPISMIETVVTMRPEYRLDADGRRARFRYDEQAGDFVRDVDGALIPDPDGRPFRNWRPEILDADDVWDAIVAATRLTGLTSAPRLQPIAARLVMLQSGMRAPMGVKVRGPDLETIQRVGLEIEALLAEVPAVQAEAVLADRVVGKPYLEIAVDRQAAARHGVSVAAAQAIIEVALGGKQVTTTVEGRERYPVRVRYQREQRDSLEAMAAALVPTSSGAHVPLDQIAEIRFVRGPQAIRTEDTFLTSYVTFDGRPGHAEVDVVESAAAHLAAALEDGRWQLPPGVSYTFAGSYENQVRAAATLRVVLPLALALIFVILQLQFRDLALSLLVFLGVFVAWAGGFALLWCYGQPWFLDVEVAGHDLRELFRIGPVQLSVAVWVGFLALFGIATDDGVMVATYLKQSLARHRPVDVAGVRAAVVEAGTRRVRACLMTTATTLLALLPVLTSDGRGADVMVPMAIPGFGGMLLAVMTMYLVPVLACWVEERRVRRGRRSAGAGPAPASPT